MKGIIGGRSIAAVVAAGLIGAFGAGPGSTPVSKAPTPPAILRSVQKKQLQAWRASYVAKRLLRWRGIGLFSRGPRWPARQPKRKLECKMQAFDGTQYVRLNTGEMVRFPAKVHRTRSVRKMIQRFRREAERRPVVKTA